MIIAVIIMGLIVLGVIYAGVYWLAYENGYYDGRHEQEGKTPEGGKERS